MATSRDINKMHPVLRRMYDEFKSRMDKEGIDFIVTCTYRDGEEQERLFSERRTLARAGQSAHNYDPCLAFDIAILKSGKCVWDKANKLWHIAGKIGVECGLEWAGNWKRFNEYPHFVLPNWKSFINVTEKGD